VLLIKAVARALGDVPELNGYWLDDRPQFQEAIHIRGRGSRAITTTGLAMAGATVAQKVLLPRTHRCAWDQWRLLLGGQRESQKYPPQDQDTEAPSLHMLPPGLLLSVRLL